MLVVVVAGSTLSISDDDIRCGDDDDGIHGGIFELFLLPMLFVLGFVVKYDVTVVVVLVKEYILMLSPLLLFFLPF